MPIRVAVSHHSTYKYDRQVSLSPHVVRLRPAPHCRTPIEAYSLRIKPDPHFLNWQQDPFGNYLARLVFPKPTDEFSIDVELIAELTVQNPFDFFIEEYAEHYAFAYEAGLRRELAPYLEAAAVGPLLAGFVERVRSQYARPGRRIIDVLVDINQHVQRNIRYDIRTEPGVFTPEETLERQHGSCRDFAWLLVQALRNLGLAARFVSGYSIQLKPDEKPLEGPAGVGEDSADLHAWAEVYLPGAGWVGLDATSGLMAGEGHIPLAATAEPSSAAPVTGAFSFEKRDEHDRVQEDFSFTMRVTRIEETPRVTKPYTEATWSAIDALGRAVDGELVAGDVRLTMGGEPTFVSLDDRDGDEWNIAALGPTKRRYAGALMQKLQRRFAPGSLLHSGHGKWYPGESLPRWNLSCYWRKDGVPMWRNPALLAAEGDAGQAGPDAAAAFVHALARRLGVEERFAQAAFEDAWYYMWRERRLPANVDPFDAKLEDEEERARLRHVFDQGLAAVAGYALPLAADGRDQANETTRWQSGPWFLRAERLYLLPGDSPMGLRLPLDSLPWVKEGEDPTWYERDPFAPRGPLPPGRRPSAEPMRQTPPVAATNRAEAPVRGLSAPGVIRTALCIEPRGGVLHVFMPPLTDAEDYLDLCAAIEDVADGQSTPVRIEGYHPPSDHRIGKLQITPDPGVIEVNIHPAGSWDELVANTTSLYEDARQTRLSTEKFLVDGRHVGTGGGNHVVIGGPTPADSPILRRPDLLRSLIGYWLNHPSLSTLFSGMFVGPTSQAPRVDEARHDSLAELEIAFRQIERRGDAPAPPWLVDRLLRHLLVDLTGNTHRTEFCIDKLFSPDSASGRQGLVELRAFEMPPHARMSLTQQLLIRGLVAWFWRAPYQIPPVRWGTELHDRFMLPHFVAQDFGDVVGDLQRAGYPFDNNWFAPHHEFRFPLHGTLQARGIDLELRQAIEPWPVLGEEPGGGGNARYVDSSVERVQIKVRGMTDGRHAIACNGQRVPLHPTGTNGEFVAGVRFRAWQPPSALHPHIGVHAPLVFDVIDQWNERSVGGCTYHVSHPGGLSHERCPLNSFEAESRRVARFLRIGRTTGHVRLDPAEPNPAFPFTLDLRR